MLNLQIYFAFNGNCEEALKFYKHCFGGEIMSLMRFSEGPMPVEDKFKNRVMHSSFKSEDIFFMACDTMPGQPFNPGNQVSLNINLDSEDRQTEIFNKLGEGGNVAMPLQDTFWGARFGMLIDKYGVPWMLNYEKAKTE